MIIEIRHDIGNCRIGYLRYLVIVFYVYSLVRILHGFLISYLAPNGFLERIPWITDCIPDKQLLHFSIEHAAYRDP